MGSVFDKVREEGRMEAVKALLKKGVIGIDNLSRLFPELTDADISAIMAETA